MRFSPSRLLNIGFALVALISVARAEITPYLGRWQIDLPATIDAIKKAPDFDSAEFEKAAPVVEKMLGSLTLTIDEASVTFAHGRQFSQRLPYTVEETKADVTTIAATSGEKVVELSLTLDATKRLRLKSSASHDADHYVWKAATGEPGPEPTITDLMAAATGGKVSTGQAAEPAPTPTIEANLNEILKGADQYRLEMAAESVTYETLVKGRYFKPLKVVNGEDYATVAIDLKAGTASVVDKDGVTHSVRR